MSGRVEALTAAPDPDWNGGAYGVVLDDGEVSVGDGASIKGPGPD